MNGIVKYGYFKILPAETILFISLREPYRDSFDNHFIPLGTLADSVRGATKFG